MANPDEIPGWQALDIAWKNILAVDRDTHLKDGAQQGQICGLAACTVGCGNDKGEIVDYLAFEFLAQKIGPILKAVCVVLNRSH